MSAENSALVVGIYESFNRGDIGRVLAVLDPEVEWVEPETEGLPHRGSHIGAEAVVEGVFAVVPAYFEDFAVVPGQVLVAGEHVVVIGRHVGVTKSGRKLDAPVVWVWRVRNGLVARHLCFPDTAAWLEALGR